MMLRDKLKRWRWAILIGGFLFLALAFSFWVCTGFTATQACNSASSASSGASRSMRKPHPLDLFEPKLVLATAPAAIVKIADQLPAGGSDIVAAS